MLASLDSNDISSERLLLTTLSEVASFVNHYHTTMFLFYSQHEVLQNYLVYSSPLGCTLHEKSTYHFIPSAYKSSQHIPDNLKRCMLNGYEMKKITRYSTFWRRKLCHIFFNNPLVCSVKHTTQTITIKANS